MTAIPTPGMITKERADALFEAGAKQVTVLAGERMRKVKVSFRTIATGAISASGMFVAMNQVVLPDKNLVLKSIKSTMTQQIASGQINNIDHQIAFTGVSLAEFINVSFAVAPAGTVSGTVQLRTMFEFQAGGDVTVDTAPYLFPQSGFSLELFPLGAFAAVLGDIINYDLDMTFNY